MDEVARAKWDERYGSDEFVYGCFPEPFLVMQVSGMEPGTALCLAAGEGRNAVYLAGRGYTVTALDISARGIDKCKALAAKRGVAVRGVQADALEYEFSGEAFDLVTNLFFLERDLYPGVMQAVKPGGRFLLQTYSQDQTRFGWGPSNPDFLLAPNELLEMFSGYRIRHYWEGVEERVDGRMAALVRLEVENQLIGGSARERDAVAGPG